MGGSFATSVSSFVNNPHDSAAADAVLQALTHSAVDPMTREDAQRALDAAANGDWKTLKELLQKYPNNPVLQDLIAKLLQKNGLKPEDAERLMQAWRSGDPTLIANTVAGLANAYPGNPLFQPGGALNNPDTNPGGYTRPSVSTSNVPTPRGGDVYDKPVTPGTVIRGGGGSVIDEREWLDEQGRIKKQTLRAVYTDFKGGQIESEKLFDSNAQRGTDGSITINPAEVPGKGIEWYFSVKETSRTPVGDGFTITFQLVNGGTPPDAQFDVTGWEGPDGKKDSTQTQFTMTFPKPGKYEVKAYGQTRTYHSVFTITQPISF
jgi:hypothetical protein